MHLDGVAGGRVPGCSSPQSGNVSSGGEKPERRPQKGRQLSAAKGRQPAVGFRLAVPPVILSHSEHRPFFPSTPVTCVTGHPHSRNLISQCDCATLINAAAI